MVWNSCFEFEMSLVRISYKLLTIYADRINDLKMIALWDTALCCLGEVDRRFRSASCLHHQDDYRIHERETTQLCISEGCHIYTRRCENLKSHVLMMFFSRPGQ